LEKSEELYYRVLGDASKIYAEQPLHRKNVKVAVLTALNKHEVNEQPMKGDLYRAVCVALGRSGGNTTAKKRQQLNLFKK
jgi:hypothetical protein